MGMYEIVYCAASLVGVYALSQAMQMLYGKNETKGYIRFLSFAGYYLVSTFAYLMWNMPIIHMLLNIICFFGLSFNYCANMKKRLFVTAFIYVMLAMAEIVILIVSKNLEGQLNMGSLEDYSSITGVILNHLWALAAVIFLKNVKIIREGMDMPFIYWACLFSVPLFSIYFIFTLIYTGNALTVSMVLSILALFVINISISILYNHVVKSMSDKTERMLLEEQNKNYLEQFKIMESSLRATKSLKHDLKNHFLALEYMLRDNHAELAEKYIKDILKEQLNTKDIHSGNATVDSILGFKLQHAEKENIKCSFKFRIPEQMPVSDKDMVVILGNILDNAIEAVRKLPEEERRINIVMQYDKNCLIIKESNPYNGQKRGNWETIKEDGENHGMGLYNINHTVKRYHGWCDIEEGRENLFVINILLCLEERTNI